MSISSSKTPFQLGAYLGNPDNASSVNQAAFQAEYDSFSGLMGTAPQFITLFVDQRQAVSQWVGNSMWSADSAAQSASARSMTPVIALPLSSNASGAASPDQQYQAFAAGQYDSVVRGIVDVWAQQGFKNLVFRPGWEMNLQGPTYAGDSAQSQADWVKAFQHVYTVLHQEAAAQGINVQVMWNPSTTNYSNAEATTNLYPGDAYVDMIGADVYSDINPYSDGGTTPTYHDWHTGKEDTTVAQFIADPVNRMHYWSEPAATEWSSDGSAGHSQSLASLIQFAQAHGKPFAVPETGAGNSNAGTDVNDDAAFPQWLAQQLAAAQATGTKIAFVSPWDSNGGGNYEFSSATSGKPAEAAAWAKYFGAQPAPAPVSTPVSAPIVSPLPAPSPAPVPTPSPTPAPVIVGTGTHTLALQASEDAWQGDAQFTISVDGTQIGGILTATASHAAGQTQTFDVLGTFAAGPHAVSVDFLNDAYAGTSATDRNLYVTGATLDGAAVPGASLALMSSGTQTFTVTAPAPPAPPPDTLDVHVSEDAWQGDAQFTIAIDGNTIGGMRSATALHGQGATQDISISGTWGSGPHTVGITFLNDAYAGSAATDRNLYVDTVTYDGTTASGAPASLMSNGTATFAVAGAPVNTTLTMHMAEDAWNGDAQFALAIDGKTVVASGSVSALNGSGQSQALTLQAMLSAGTHDLAISFLNDAYGGTSATDRNLYVKGIDVNGTSLKGATTELYSNGVVHFEFLTPPS